MSNGKTKRVRVLINRKSGLAWSFDDLQNSFAKHWERPGTELTYQFTHTKEDGAEKAARAAAEKLDTLVVVGGDGTVSTAGAALIGSSTALGVVPVGSGNGFARHFSIPLDPAKAVKALADAETLRIDVGYVDKRPFLVTCSMAWDANVVRTFEKSPVRGIIPYIFAGAYEFFEFTPQPMTVLLDSGETLDLPDAALFTLANLTQYGAGVMIAPEAKADDGYLELVAARIGDMPILLANLPRVFTGTFNELKQVIRRRFKRLTVRRQTSGAIQLDGELVDAPSVVEVHVEPRCLSVLVPRTGTRVARTRRIDL